MRYTSIRRQAEPLFKRSLAIKEKALGLVHPDVAEACATLLNTSLKLK